jgi:twinkle protein
MSNVINSFDKFAGSNLLKNIDLTAYASEDVQHNVKAAAAYKNDMIRRLMDREAGDSNATPMPFNLLRNKFEFRQYELTIWAGYKGHGKSLMISQILMSAIKRGKRVFIFSPEFRPESVLERMLFQYCLTTSPSVDEINSFFDFLLDRMWIYDTQASMKSAEVVALCRYVAKEIEVDHILIDSLMKCGMPPDDYSAQKLFVDQVQSVAHANPLHIHLVAHARKGNDDSKPPRLHDIKGASEIADMAENVLCVWRNKEKEKGASDKAEDPDASLTVEAQRNSDGWIGTVNLMHDPDSMLFFEPGQGGIEHVRF